MFAQIIRRSIQRSSLLALSLLAAGVASAANFTTSQTFAPADATRGNYMDRAGVWNGSADVTSTTGDTFTALITNDGSTAYDLSVEVELPAGFSYVNASASVSTVGVASPAVTASQSGTTLTFTLASGEFDLTGGGDSIEIDYGLVAADSVVGGTYQINYSYIYGDDENDASPTTVTSAQNVLVQAGDSVLSLGPSTQLAGVGEIATWEVTVTNSGFGGLFDVEIDQSDLFGNASFTGVSTTQTSPVNAATESGNVYTIPYLAPGEVFSFTTTAELAGCSDLGQIVLSDDRTGETNVSKVAAVVLDLDLPLVDFTAPSITLDYEMPTSVSIPIHNLDANGLAKDFKLATNFNSLPVSISNVGGGFAYDPLTGEFALVSGANGTAIGASDTATLTFDVTPDNTCSVASVADDLSTSWLAIYANECGQVYLTPFDVTSFETPTGQPSIGLSSTASLGRLAVGQNSTIDIALSAAEIDRIATDPILVDISIDAGTASINSVVPAAGTLTDLGGGDYQWSVSKADAGAGQVLVVDFTINPDPCLGGEEFIVSATTSAESVLTSSGDVCPLENTATSKVFVTSSPGAESEQFFDVTGSSFEAGLPSTTNAVQEIGEGDFIPISTEYSFEAGYPGEWTDSSYIDDFGGVASQQLVAGTLLIRYGPASGSLGTPVAVPSGSYTKDANGLTIDLSFLAGAGFFGDDSVSDTQIKIDYQTTIPDAALSGGSMDVQHHSTFRLNNSASSASCLDGMDSIFRQTLLYSVQRAVATLKMEMPKLIGVCEVFDVKITLDNANGRGISSPLITIDTTNTDYEYVVAQTPVYGGSFNTGNITYSANGGNSPTFEYTGGGDFPGNGTVTVQMVRTSGSGTVITPVAAQVDYDDNETSITPTTDFTVTDDAQPKFVLTGELTAVVTPSSSIQMNDSQIEWSIIVQNVNSGTAYGAELLNNIPEYLMVNETLTNAANSGVSLAVTGSVTSGGQLATFDLGDMYGGEFQTIKVIVDLVPGSNCGIVDGQNIITAQWGCSDIKAQTVVTSGPEIRFGSGSLQILHDTSNSLARLCGNGEVVIRVKNTGDGTINDINIFELMSEATTGLSLVSGSVEYATDNAPSSFTAIADPTGNGDSGNPYTFNISDGGQIDLSELVGVTEDDGSTVNEVIIRFDIVATDPNVFAGISGPSLTASGDATLFCDEVVASPGVPFVIPVELPDLSTGLTVANTTLSLPAAERVPGANTQVIDWSYEIINSGNAIAENVRIRIPITASGGSATISGHGASGAYTGAWVALNDIDPGETVTVVVTETLGNTCVDTLSTAEVTWGCDNSVPVDAPSAVTQPTDNDDTAEVLMSPDFITSGGTFSQQFNRSNDARGRVRITMNNQGAKAINLAITEALPNNVEYDSSVAPIFSSNSSSLTAVAVDDSAPASPIFNFTGEVDFNESFTLEFYVRSVIEDANRATTFPNLSEEEETANSLDPNIDLGGDATVTADYENSCGNILDLEITSDVDPRQPDLDINLAASNGSETADLTNRIVFPGVEETFDIYVRNEGEDNSVAANNTITVTLGAGWTSPSVTLGGTNASAAGNVYTFSPSDVGSINKNGEVHIVVKATPSGADSDPLSLQVDVDSDQILQDDSTVGGELSNDSRAFRVLGVEVEKELVLGSSSESFTDDPNLAIGEEVAYDLRVKFSGGSSDPSAISNLVIRDSLGNTAAADRGLGLVSATVTGAELVPAITTTPSGMTSADPLVSGVVDFTLASPGAIIASNDEFTARVIARVLNDTNIAAVNSDNKSLVNHFGLSLDFHGVTYHSDDSNDGFSGGISVSHLHDQDTITVQRPTMSIEKEVRNVTAGGGFAESASGEATNIFEYRVVLTNEDSTAVTVPIFDLEWEDQLNGKLNLLDGSSNALYTPGADTTGNGTVDVFFTGGVTTGAGGKLEVNATNLNINNAGEDLAQLDPGESITIHYFVSAENGVNPGEVIVNTVTATGDTLPGISGSQTVTTGSTGDDDGALELNAEDTASITVYEVSQSKIISNTSVGADDSATVQIGEQVAFEVMITLPQGTTPDLKIIDTLSEEFQLIEIGNVTLGAAVTATNASPVTSPSSGALPVNGGSLDFTWAFGDTVVDAGTDAERSITVRYTTQIRNLDPASLKLGDTFKNSANYTFTGSSADIIDITLTTAESKLVVTKTATPTEDLDAGDEVTYTVTLSNAAGTAPAYDVNILDTLPAGLSYKAGSTTLLSGAGETSGLDGALAEPDLDPALNELTWGREQSSSVNLDIAAGGQLVFTYIATLDDTVEANQTLTNDLVADWTSLDGDPGPDLGVTVGTGGDDNGERLYTGSSEATVTVANTTTQTTKTASGDTLPLITQDDGFRVGDVVTYTIEVDVMEGTHEEFKIIDTLPSGMAFVGFDAITPATGADGFTYTALVAGTTAPVAAATGELVFDLGTIVNTGDALTDNDTLTLVYRARIMDVSAVTVPDGDESTDDSSLTLTNSVKVSFLDVEDEVVTTEPTTEAIVVKQPELSIEKERLLPIATNKLLEGETARFRLTVTNSGDAPAYNLEVLDTVPAGMRDVEPVFIAATLDGADVLASLSPASYSAASGEWRVGELSNTQILEVGKTLIIVYDIVMDDVVAGGQTLTNQADVPVYYSKPSDETDERRAYDNVLPDSEEILTTVSVSGTVFKDLSHNRTLDPIEDWSEGVTVYVNLVEAGNVIDSIEVSPGSGEYEFERVSGGNYVIILTDSPSNVSPVQPPEFIFYESAPTDGQLNVIVGAVDIFDQDFPLVTGGFITGVVFQDDGIGSGTPNDGLQNGGEVGLARVTVRLTDGGSNVYATVQTNGAGEFSLFVPGTVADGATLVVEEYNLPSYLSTGGDGGTTGGTYSRPSDTITFTYEPGISQSDLAFGDVPANSFITDGQQTIEPGAVAFYSHTFTAETGGTVSFDVSTLESPALPGWGQTLFLDSNCNGELDSGEAQLSLPSASITVTAGESICIIVKDSSPAGAPFGAQNQNTVTATFSYTNSDPAIADDVLVRTDVTTIGQQTTAGLELIKAVDKAIASPGEVITYTLTYTNNGVGALDAIVIYDSTPAFTTFAAAPVPTYPLTLSNVTIAAPNVGEVGGIVWTFDGQLQPGETGTVVYQVTLDDD
ncbi:isopeptide-forming domain-containing fimbrial protein [Coraliomargarita sp. W4R53]